jgi:hypothetical protein
VVKLFFWEFFINDFAQNVHQQFLPLLNPRRGISLHDQINRRRAFRETAVATEETNAFDSLAFRLFERAQNIFRFAARRERDQHVAFFAEAVDLPRENFVRVIIVAHGSHEFAVGRERDGRIWTAVFLEPAEKFRGEVRGVRRAAAIAADEQFFARSQAGQNQFRRAVQRFFQTRQSAKRRDGIFNRLLQMRHVCN